MYSKRNVGVKLWTVLLLSGAEAENQEVFGGKRKMSDDILFLSMDAQIA